MIHLDRPDTRRKMAFAYPCWKIFPTYANQLFTAALAQDTIGGCLKKLGTDGIYFLVCLPAIGNTQGVQPDKSYLYTRSGSTMVINNEPILATFSGSGLVSGPKKIMYTFPRLPINFGTSLYNFLYKSSGEHVLIADPMTNRCRAAMYTKKDVTKTPNFQGEEMDINAEFTIWELNSAAINQ